MTKNRKRAEKPFFGFLPALFVDFESGLCYNEPVIFFGG